MYKTIRKKNASKYKTAKFMNDGGDLHVEFHNSLKTIYHIAYPDLGYLATKINEKKLIKKHADKDYVKELLTNIKEQKISENNLKKLCEDYEDNIVFEEYYICLPNDFNGRERYDEIQEIFGNKSIDLELTKNLHEAVPNSRVKVDENIIIEDLKLITHPTGGDYIGDYDMWIEAELYNNVTKQSETQIIATACNCCLLGLDEMNYDSEVFIFNKNHVVNRNYRYQLENELNFYLKKVEADISEEISNTLADLHDNTIKGVTEAITHKLQQKLLIYKGKIK